MTFVDKVKAPTKTEVIRKMDPDTGVVKGSTTLKTINISDIDRRKAGKNRKKHTKLLWQMAADLETIIKLKRGDRRE